jgi:hypothetical protein
MWQNDHPLPFEFYFLFLREELSCHLDKVVEKKHILNDDESLLLTYYRGDIEFCSLHKQIKGGDLL